MGRRPARLRVAGCSSLGGADRDRSILRSAHEASRIVRVEMRIDGDLPPGDWSPIGEVRHGDQVLRFVSGDFDAGPDGTIAYMTDGGVDDASGEWTVTVDELVGGEGDARLAGPWVLQFSAP